MDQMEKPCGVRRRLIAIVIVAACINVDAASTSDPLTGLPVYPGVSTPSPLPKAIFCGKQMEKDVYIVMGKRVDVVTAWYARHLPGHRRYHFSADGRSQDTFFSRDGTQEITVTGSKAGPEVYSISYGRFQSALTTLEMASFNQPKKGCN